jgi:serine phosphatase RsbU (regulator of sigma subunit)
METAGEQQRPGGEPFLSVHAVTVYVRDQERSARFYVEKLGFQIAFDARLQSGRRWVAVGPADGNTVLALVAPEPGTAEERMIGRSTGVVFVTDNVLKKYAEWSGLGVRFRHSPRLRRVKFDKAEPEARQDAPWGSVFTRFEDVDRNSFTLVSFDEVSRAVEAERRAAARKLETERQAAREMEIAREVQARLFPQSLPPAATLEYAGVCIQARQVGGDYYDFLRLGQGRLGLVIGDVAGKGIAAALLMANLQANLRSQCAIALDEPHRFLESVNRQFHENTIEGAYATLFFAEYDDQAMRLRYANCGHLCGLLQRRGGRMERLDSTATVLGLFSEWKCEIGELSLEAGDVLALYTDGVTESFDAGGEEFGEERLCRALRRHGALPAEAMLDGILDEVRQYSPDEQRDDITLVVARCRGQAAG